MEVFSNQRNNRIRSSRPQLLLRFCLGALTTLSLSIYSFSFGNVIPEAENVGALYRSIEEKDVGMGTRNRVVSDIVNVDKIPSPAAIAGPEAVPAFLHPIFGRHRQEKDAILGIAEGYQIDEIIMFLSTLREVNYTGDCVLSLNWNETNNTTRDWLLDFRKRYPNRPNLVIYDSKTNCDESGRTDKRRKECTASLFKNRTTGEMLTDPRKPRHIAMIRFEIFWIWVQRYSTRSRIAGLDVRDLFFQRNPFDDEFRNQLRMQDLHVFQEGGKNLGGVRGSASGRWLKQAWGKEVLIRFKDKKPINVGAAIGGQPAIDAYFRALVKAYDDAGWGGWGNDQAHACYVIYNNCLDGTNVQVHVNKMGDGLVITMGAFKKNDTQWVRFSNDDKITVITSDGNVSPIVHQFTSHIRKYFFSEKNQLVQEWDRLRHGSFSSGR